MQELPSNTCTSLTTRLLKGTAQHKPSKWALHICLRTHPGHVHGHDRGWSNLRYPKISMLCIWEERRHVITFGWTYMPLGTCLTASTSTVLIFDSATPNSQADTHSPACRPTHLSRTATTTLIWRNLWSIQRRGVKEKTIACGSTSCCAMRCCLLASIRSMERSKLT